MRGQRLRSAWVVSMLAAVVAAASTACSGPVAPPPKPSLSATPLPAVDRSIAADARASLNEATGEVVLPMDKYWYSDREKVFVNNAVAFLIEDCVEAAGFTVVPWGGDGKALEDGRFGPWSRALAARNGAMPETRRIPGVLEEQAGPPVVSSEQQQAASKCSNSVGRAGFPELLEGLAGDTSIQNRIGQIAAALTARDPEYLEYRKAWEACVEGKGLKLLEEEGTWTLKSSGSKEDDIRVALLGIECKESSGGVRKPYDIVAQYQAAQMKGHQAELNTLAEQKAAAVERARQVLRDHGVADAKL